MPEVMNGGESAVFEFRGIGRPWRHVDGGQMREMDKIWVKSRTDLETRETLKWPALGVWG